VPSANVFPPALSYHRRRPSTVPEFQKRENVLGFVQDLANDLRGEAIGLSADLFIVGYAESVAYLLNCATIDGEIPRVRL
jgi:hypothetical protein